MLADAVTFLICPVCGSGLALEGRAVACTNGHSFDVARQGYVNLAPSDDADRYVDTSAMVAARASFLDTGHYSPLADALAGLAESLVPQRSPGGCVLDIGGGTGYYLARALDALPSAQGIVLDRSKYAARVAARAHPRGAAVVANVWKGLPVRDRAASLVLDVFAPRNAPEIARVLRPDGALVVVTPERDHLRGLTDVLGLLDVDGAKDERLAEQFDARFEPARREALQYTMLLNREDVARLVAMGPSAWHVDHEVLAAGIARLREPVTVHAAFAIRVYRPKDPDPV